MTSASVRRAPTRMTGEWMSMASHRIRRTFLPAAHSCPLDLGRLHLQLFSVLRAPHKLKYLAGR